MSSLRLFRVLHLRQLRHQPVRAVLALVSLAAGVSISVASMLLLSTVRHADREQQRVLAGPAPLRVVGPLIRGGLDSSVVARVSRVPGVDDVVPMVQTSTFAETRGGREGRIAAIGVDCHIEALVGPFGCDKSLLTPSRRNAPLVISPLLARDLGEGAVVRTNVGRVGLDGVPTNDTLDDTNSGGMAVFDLATAQRVFTRNGRLDALYVEPDTGVSVDALQERIRKVVGPWNYVLRRDEPGPAEIIGGPIGPLLAITVLIALGFSGMLVYNIVSLSLAARRRDFAVAGGVGADPRAVTLGTLAEALLLGVVGGVLGGLAGVGLGSLIMRQVASVFGFGFAKLHVSPFVLLAGVGLGAVTAVVASYVPARRSRALDLAAELHGRATRVEETLERSRVRLAIWVVTGAVAILLSQIAQRNGAMERWQPPLATGALALASVSLIAAVGAAAPLLLAVALRALRTTSGPIRVAVANLVANPRRTSVVATAAGASVALACVFATLGPAIQGVVSSIVGKAAGGRVWVSTLDANNSGTVEARPSRRVLATLASLPGIEAVDESPCTSVVDDAGLVSVCAYDGGRTLPFETIAGRVDARAFDQGEVILGPGAARSRGLRPGSVFRMRTPTGFIPLTVAGIWDNLQANGYSATVSPRRFTELFGRLSPASVFVRPTAGVSAAELVRRIGAADLDPDLYALTPASYVRRLSSEIGEQVTPFWSLQRAVLFTALVAAMSTLLLVGVQRRRELGVLGAVGFGPAGLARMTLVEAAAAGFSGAVLGVVASLGLFVVFSSASLAAVGHTLPFRFETPSAIVAVGLAVVVVAVGGLLPAWRTARLQIVDAIRDE